MNFYAPRVTCNGRPSAQSPAFWRQTFNKSPKRSSGMCDACAVSLALKCPSLPHSWKLRNFGDSDQYFFLVERALGKLTQPSRLWDHNCWAFRQALEVFFARSNYDWLVLIREIPAGFRRDKKGSKLRNIASAAIPLNLYPSLEWPRLFHYIACQKLTAISQQKFAWWYEL